MRCGDRWDPHGYQFELSDATVTCAGGEYQIVRDLAIDDFSRERMNLTLTELEEERAMLSDLLR